MSLMAASVGLVNPAGAQQEPDPLASTPFSVAAQAAPVAVEFIDSDAPVIPRGELLYVTPTITRAALDSVGNSAGFAAAPYPGDAIPALMGAFNAVSPTGPVLPEYPFSVSSQYPGNAEQANENGPHQIASTSSENGSEAKALVGVAGGDAAVASMSSRSLAQQDPGGGTLTAQAASVVDGFSVGPTLTVGRVSGYAEMTAQPGEPPTKRTAFSVASLTVMGTIVGLTDKGLVPVPGTSPGTDLDAITGQLSQAGITLALLPAVETDSTIDSAALAVGFTRDVPTRGLVTTTIILGRVRAQLSSGAPETSSERSSTEEEEIEAYEHSRGEQLEQPGAGSQIHVGGRRTERRAAGAG